MITKAAQILAALEQDNRRRGVGYTALVAAGLTERQIDYWTVKGYLRADTAKPGSGNRRSYSADEVRCARLMVQLVAAGLRIEKAALIAREPDHVTTLLLGLLATEEEL